MKETFKIRVGNQISHLHEFWNYITWGRFQNPHHSTCLMLDYLARKRHYVCCCRKELLILGFVSCWQLVHTPHIWLSLVLFLFLCITRLSWHTLCVDWLGCKTFQLCWTAIYSFFISLDSYLIKINKLLNKITCHTRFSKDQVHV